MDRAAPRSGKVEVTLTDGRKLEHFVPHAYGTKQNPMSTESVNAKVRELIEPVLGSQRTGAIIQRVNTLETLANVRELVRLLTLSSQEMAGVTYSH
jgi:2-methylcitrate dehydratase PrpD